MFGVTCGLNLALCPLPLEIPERAGSRHREAAGRPCADLSHKPFTFGAIPSRERSGGQRRENAARARSGNGATRRPRSGLAWRVATPCGMNALGDRSRIATGRLPRGNPANQSRAQRGDLSHREAEGERGRLERFSETGSLHFAESYDRIEV